MEFQYSYIRKRLEFGSDCTFAPEGPKLLYNEMPDKTLADKYIVKTPVNKGVQEERIFSGQEVNTRRVDFADRGMNHDQGGWPKDLNILDEEAVLRYRKKLEREDIYINSMRCLTKTLEDAVLQNNAVNIYQTYYEEIIKKESVPETLTSIRNIFKDIGSKESRQVTHLSWCPFWGNQFAVSYCNTRFQVGALDCTEAYIWNIEIPNVPVETFNSSIPIVCLEWNASDQNLLAGGMSTGDLTLFDMRKAPQHVGITPDVLRHRDPVHSVVWINSKTGFDFFSTSSDGVIKWWDCRNLKQTTDSLILDLGKTQNITRARSASCLEYDPTIPARFMVGTEDGYVISGNRKGANAGEKLPWNLLAHYGPVYSIQRNQAFSKNYLTVGDWRARIWSEDCKESPIMWMKTYKTPVVAGEWSKSRHSVFILARGDGYLDVWDLLQNQSVPEASVKISDKPLTALRFEGGGSLAVIGDEQGITKLVQLGQTLITSDKNAKTNLSSMFDRETRREKILETRMKEIKLAMKLKKDKAEEVISSKVEGEFENEDILRAEEYYWEDVNLIKEAYERAAKTKKSDPVIKEEEEQEEMEEAYE